MASVHEENETVILPLEDDNETDIDSDDVLPESFQVNSLFIANMRRLYQLRADAPDVDPVTGKYREEVWGRDIWFPNHSMKDIADGNLEKDFTSTWPAKKTLSAPQSAKTESVSDVEAQLSALQLENIRLKEQVAQLEAATVLKAEPERSPSAVDSLQTDQEVAMIMEEKPTRPKPLRAVGPGESSEATIEVPAASRSTPTGQPALHRPKFGNRVNTGSPRLLSPVDVVVEPYRVRESPVPLISLEEPPLLPIPICQDQTGSGCLHPIPLDPQISCDSQSSGDLSDSARRAGGKPRKTRCAANFFTDKEEEKAE